jgi:lipid-A-disaccharide synthase
MSAPRPPTAGPAAEPLTLLMVAGEASGDAHGAELIHALREERPGVRIIGVGGPKMAAAGQEQLFDLSVHAVVGLTQVVRHYFKFRYFFGRVLALARKENPQATVLIDYPGFNLRIAARPAGFAHNFLHQPAGLGLESGPREDDGKGARSVAGDPAV